MIAARRIEAARDNLRAAFRTAAGDSDVANALAISVALTRYAGIRIWSEPWSWCEEALTMPGAADHPLRPGALVRAASDGAWQLGDHIRSMELADAAIAITEPGSSAWRKAHGKRAAVLVWLGRVDDAITSATAASERAEVSYDAVFASVCSVRSSTSPVDPTSPSLNVCSTWPTHSTTRPPWPSHSTSPASS